MVVSMPLPGSLVAVSPAAVPCTTDATDEVAEASSATAEKVVADVAAKKATDNAVVVARAVVDKQAVNATAEVKATADAAAMEGATLEVAS
jgi:hypothetical protein